MNPQQCSLASHNYRSVDVIDLWKIILLPHAEKALYFFTVTDIINAGPRMNISWLPCTNLRYLIQSHFSKIENETPLKPLLKPLHTIRVSPCACTSFLVMILQPGKLDLMINFRFSGHFNVRRAYDYDALLCFRIWMICRPSLSNPLHMTL